MCLAIPGKIISMDEGASSLTRTGAVAFGEAVRRVNLSGVPTARVGDYVVVHVGFALSVIDPVEAERTLAEVEELTHLMRAESQGTG